MSISPVTRRPSTCWTLFWISVLWFSTLLVICSAVAEYFGHHEQRCLALSLGRLFVVSLATVAPENPDQHADRDAGEHPRHDISQSIHNSVSRQDLMPITLQA